MHNVLGLHVPRDHQIYKVPTVCLATDDQHPATDHSQYLPALQIYTSHTKCLHKCFNSKFFSDALWNLLLRNKFFFTVGDDEAGLFLVSSFYILDEISASS